MKNKKILNICLLTFALMSLITFIIPLSKFSAELNEKMIINIMFYLTNGIMIACVLTIIVLSIINLFKDNYTFVMIMEALSLISVTLVFINLVMFAALFNFAINIGYILVAIEVFLLANFSQMARLVGNRKNMAANINTKFKKKQKKEPEKKETLQQKTEQNDNAKVEQNITKESEETGK